MNCKAKGNRNEYKSIRLPEAAGYACTRAVEMEAIEQFKAPVNCRKLIHRWRDRQTVPDVKEVA